MAGVASGLALATTLMAMQVADSMSTRGCPYRSNMIDVTAEQDHAYLGITYVFRDGSALVQRVAEGTPAEAVGIQKGDRVIAIDGDTVESSEEVQHRIYGAHPGYRPMIEIKRNGMVHAVTPTLIQYPGRY